MVSFIVCSLLFIQYIQCAYNGWEDMSSYDTLPRGADGMAIAYDNNTNIIW